MANKKIFIITVIGNILDYYDFLLFAHMGNLIISKFIPMSNQTVAHIFSLFIFAMSYLVRPIGGYFFGLISDKKSRSIAISRSMFLCFLATIGLGVLPYYKDIGYLSIVFFIILRFMQGCSVGGEYTTAGTYIFEMYPDRQGFFTSVLAASANLGSLLALVFAFVYFKNQHIEWLWRVGFLIGGVAAFISFLLRMSLPDVKHKKDDNSAITQCKSPQLATLLIGFLTAVVVWIPLIYSNFYFTKILNKSTEFGMAASFIGAVSYIISTLVFGYISDRFNHYNYISFCATISVPILGVLGFYLLCQGNLFAQVVLGIGAATFGAPIHVVMNKLFSPSVRSRYINVLFSIGISLGSLMPGLSSSLVYKTKLSIIPCLALVMSGIIVGILLRRLRLERE